MRNKKQTQIENAANTTRNFYSENDGNGLYEIRFGYKKDMGAGCGFLHRQGTCTLEASSQAEALEIFESLPATKTINRTWTKVYKIENAIIWNMEA